ncbi:MAG: hypothetical protein FJ088_06860 [Deltaproteobacteria bacterium]|nr:hypothetical protein [Deltaproteobacteria bacterium]
MSEKKRMGRPPVADERVRFSCRLDPDVDELLRRELAERAVVQKERVPTSDGKGRLLDAGDIVGAALEAYFEKTSKRKR